MTSGRSRSGAVPRGSHIVDCMLTFEAGPDSTSPGVAGRPDRGDYIIVLDLGVCYCTEGTMLNTISD